MSTGARRLRVSAVLLLLVWGTLDQVHFYFALHQDNLADLQRAAALASFDSTVQTRLGRKEFAVGKTDQAVAAWQQALQANPSASAPRDALLRYLASQKRFDEAYVLADQSLRYAPQDPNLLLNHGILALELGRPEEAAANWTKAVSLDPALPLAHLYLANELDKEGKWEAAIPHYITFLQQVARARGPNRVPPENTVAVVLQLAQCHQNAGHPEQAESSYELAQKISAQVGQKKLQSLASVGEAALESQQKKIPQALRLYQSAITLDRESGDRASEASDWYSYGIFLRDAGLPPRLAYACLVESESLTRSLENATEIKDAALAREELEGKIANEASAIRRDPQPALEQALSFSVSSGAKNQ